ncbi:MAG: CSLREA domain-containing protein [Oscillochloris sp.]|nr:CSLREA domain-containing protein [Oscillochloris sp.]
MSLPDATGNRPNVVRHRVGSLLLRLSLIVILALILFPPASTPVFAASIVVNTTADENGTGGACSLREAITAANINSAYGGCSAGSGTDTITFTVMVRSRSLERRMMM